MHLIHGDALQELRKLETGCADAFVTDPPYASGGFSEAARASATSQGICKASEAANGWFAGDNIGTEGLCWLLREMAVEAHRIMKPDGSLLVFADWRMVPTLAPAIASAGYRYQNQIIWDKGSTGLGAGFRAQYEVCLHFTKGRGRFFALDASNVINQKRVKQAVRRHQTQKPVELIKELLRVVCPVGGLVVDPFGGSGTTAVAAHELGMRSVTIEREPKNITIAAGRLAESAINLMGGGIMGNEQEFWGSSFYKAVERQENTKEYGVTLESGSTIMYTTDIEEARSVTAKRLLILRKMARECKS